jgi:hypothetical protein
VKRGGAKPQSWAQDAIPDQQDGVAAASAAAARVRAAATQIVRAAREDGIVPVRETEELGERPKPLAPLVEGFSDAMDAIGKLIAAHVTVVEGATNQIDQAVRDSLTEATGAVAQDFQCQLEEAAAAFRQGWFRRLLALQIASAILWLAVGAATGIAAYRFLWLDDASTSCPSGQLLTDRGTGRRYCGYWLDPDGGGRR